MCKIVLPGRQGEISVMQGSSAVVAIEISGESCRTVSISFAISISTASNRFRHLFLNCNARAWSTSNRMNLRISL